MKLRTCVVIVGKDDCGDPVFDERGGFPMCKAHFDLFAPSDNDTSAVTQGASDSAESGRQLQGGES